MLADKTVEKGLLIVHTGTGKGKSTAAFGLVARAIGNGMKVGVVQFVKGKWETGERLVLDQFPDHLHHSLHGRGLHLGNPGHARATLRRPMAAWVVSKEMIADPSYDLDRAGRAQHRACATTIWTSRTCSRRSGTSADMLHVDRHRAGTRKPALIEIADLVTEMAQSQASLPRTERARPDEAWSSRGCWRETLHERRR